MFTYWRGRVKQPQGSLYAWHFGFEPGVLSASNTVTFSQAATLNVVTNRTASNTLTFGQNITGGGTVKLFITSGTTFEAPPDWPGYADIVECIGGGGGGARSNNAFENASGGGGGGGYSRTLNVTAADGCTIQVGAGGASDQSGGDTWFNGADLASSSCGAKGGTVGNHDSPPTSTGGAGGAAASGVGDVKYSGGRGGNSVTSGLESGGGGGAAGPHGDGGRGGDAVGISAAPGGGGNGGGGDGQSDDGGGNGGDGGTAWDGTPGGAGGTASMGGFRGDGSNGSGGGGGSAVDGSGGSGGAGNDFDATHGSGGGGGGADTDNDPVTGGAGGLYGGGGGGGPYNNSGTGGGVGAQGIIVLTYQSGPLVSKPISNTITFTHEAIGTLDDVYLEEAENELEISQSVSVSIVYDEPASNDLEFTQELIAFIPNQRATQVLSMTSDVDVNLILERTLSNTLTVFQVAEATQIRPASNEITFTDEATATISKGVLSIFAITQDATLNILHNAVAISPFVMVSAATASRLLPRAPTNAFTINQSATATKVKLLSADNTFVIVQLAENALIEFASNTLVFSNTAVASKVVELTVSQTLPLQHAVTRVMTYNLNPSSVLAFQHVYLQPTMIGGIFELVPVPELILTKVINRVSFRTKDRAIILRPPLLNDSEGGNGKIVLQRTITGGTYVYARRVSTRLLKYTFETDTFKALEMRRFMLDCLSEPIWLENWRGEIWVGYFMNNPFDITTNGISAPCGEWHSFDVDFEGERIH